VGISTVSIHYVLTDDSVTRRVFPKHGSRIMTTHHPIPRNFLGQSQHSCGSTGSLLSRHGSLRFLAVSPPGNKAESVDLSHETTLYATRRLSFTPFAKRHSRNASNNGGTAGRSLDFFNELYYDARIHEHKKKYVPFHVSPCLCLCVRVRETAKGTLCTHLLNTREGISGSINAGNFLTSCKVYWLASQEGLCSME
jgi:hypothetical protein